MRYTHPVTPTTSADALRSVMMPLFVVAPLFALMLAYTPTAFAQPVMFHPGNTYEDVGAQAGAASACQTNHTEPFACVHSFNTIENALSAAVGSDGMVGLPPERSNASMVVSVYKDFRISPTDDGGEADLINSQISANLRWSGTLLGNGGLGTAGYKIEFLVIDRTDPSHPAVAYVKVDERSESGSFSLKIVKGVPLVLPTPGYDLIQLEDLRTVLPVPLKRGRTYRVRLSLTLSSLGGVGSGAIADFMQPLPGLPNPSVYWDDLTVTVGVDMLSLIHDLQVRMDALEQQHDQLAAQVDANTLAIADNTATNETQAAAIEANAAGIAAAQSASGRNFNRISANEQALRVHQTAIEDNAKNIAAITGSADFDARIDSLERQIHDVEARVAANAAAIGDSSSLAALWEQVVTHAEAIDTLALDVRSWTSVIETNTTAIVQTASVLASNSDSTAVLQQWVSCHVHPDLGTGRTGLPQFASDCAEEEHTAVGAVAESDLPQAYALDPNYPNPFNPSTTIGFALPKSADVRLAVYDLQGREVAELMSGSRAAGRYQVTWDASGFSSGVYLYRIEAGSFVASRSLVLVK